MSDQWMMAMTKAIEVVDNKAASLDAMTQRYSAMLDAAIGRMSGTRMEPVAALQMPTAPNIVAPPRIPQDGPDDFPEGADLEIREPSPIDIGSLLADLDVSDLEIPPAPELVTMEFNGADHGVDPQRLCAPPSIPTSKCPWRRSSQSRCWMRWCLS